MTLEFKRFALCIGTSFDCAFGPSSAWLRHRAAYLEGQLLATDDAIDDLLARYAAGYVDAAGQYRPLLP